METRNGFTTQTGRTHVTGWNVHSGQLPERKEPLVCDVLRHDAELRTGQVGTLRFVRLTCNGNAVDRGPQTAGQAELAGSYTLLVQLEGTGELSQYGQTAELSPGDLALYDTSAPFRHHMEAGSAALLLRLPAKALRLHLPSPDQYCGRRLAGDTGMAGVAASLVRNVYTEANTNLPPSAQECLSRQVLETVAMAFTLAFGQLLASSSVVGGRYARARLFIEQNLSDPDLGPHTIARSLKVSARYLRMIFAREGECISSYVLRRRLEETARQLADPRWRGRSICEIAFQWGFNSAPHFSRSFRGHFGMSPREYRALHAGTHARQPDPLAGTR